jgi:hypothetical protein
MFRLARNAEVRSIIAPSDIWISDYHHRKKHTLFRVLSPGILPPYLGSKNQPSKKPAGGDIFIRNVG